jgi:SRSO17 transposase
LTGLAGAEPIAGAQHREVQRLQWFLTESTWDHQQVNEQRVQLLCQDLATAPHEQGVLVIDDTGDRKDGTATAHVARQYLGSVGKIDNGIVAVTSLWADERVYWPVQVVPYTPASRLAKGKRDPGFRTKPQLAVELVEAAQQAGIGFRAVVADCAYGDNPGFTQALGAAKVPFVLALKPRKGTWAPADAAHPRPRQPPSSAGRTQEAWPGAAYPAALPRRPDRELVGGRRDPRRLGSGPAAAAGGGHHRPGQPARAQQLVPADQPPPTGRPPRPAGQPG